MKLIRVLLIILVTFTVSNSYGQLLKKLKEAAKKEAKSFVDEPVKEETSMSTPDTQPHSSNSNNTENRRGKKMTPPDVNENIEMAADSYASESYGDARYAIKQAIIGVELEIGHLILDELPETVNGMKSNKEDDEIYTAGIGFMGLNIGRYYEPNSEDKSLQVGVSNNSAMGSAIAMSSGMGYGSENEKMVRVQGFKGIMRYEEYEGYTLAVDIGQSSVFLMDCNNFEDEDEVLTIAENFNIKRIQELLGEQ